MRKCPIVSFPAPIIFIKMYYVQRMRNCLMLQQVVRIVTAGIERINFCVCGPLTFWHRSFTFNPLNAELNPICYLLAILGAHHFLHVSRIRVKSLTLRLLMSYIYIYIYIYIYGAPILDVSRSHTTTHHSR